MQALFYKSCSVDLVLSVLTLSVRCQTMSHWLVRPVRARAEIAECGGWLCKIDRGEYNGVDESRCNGLPYSANSLIHSTLSVRRNRHMSSYAILDDFPTRQDFRKETYDFNKLRKRITRDAGKAIVDFNMILDGDRIMVCVSGGKDSYTMLDILLDLQKRAPVRFEITAVNLDQKQPGFPENVLPDYFESLEVDYRILSEDTYSIVTSVIEPGKTMCGLCSRLRRGILYRYAVDHNFTKIALGHHRDDIVETLFLNMFHGGKLKAMPPKLKSDDGRNVVIRPLAYCKESDIARFAQWRKYPIIPCNLCGSQENLQRVRIKRMLREWEQHHPGRSENIFRSVQNVAPSQLADRDLFDFASLEPERQDDTGQ